MGRAVKLAGRAAVALVALGLAVLLPASPAAAVTCLATIAEQDASASSSSAPIRLAYNQPTVVRLLSPGPVTRVRVSVVLAGAQVPVHDQAVAPTRRWAGLVGPGGLGAGLYEVQLDAGSCTAIAWVRVEGRSPLTTPAGIGATATMGIGLGMLAAGLLRARRRDGLGLSIVGGALIGLGANVLTQQIGLHPLTRESLAIWVVLPGSAGGLLNAGLRTATRTISTAPPVGQPPSPPPVSPPQPPPPPPAYEPPPSPPPPPSVEPPPVEVPPGQPAPERDPPRTSHARLDCPDAVVAGEEFEIVVGLRAAPDPGVIAEPLVRPAWSVGDWTLTAQLVAEGFRLRPGETARRELPVTADAPYPSVAFHLVADGTGEQAHPTSIRVLYSAEGHTMGMAERPLVVLREAGTPYSPAPAAAGVGLGAPPSRGPSDLTIRILRSTSSPSSLVWTFDTAPALGVATTGVPAVVSIGADPTTFAARLQNQVSGITDWAKLGRRLRGHGAEIARAMPSETFDLLEAVAARVAPRPPTVMILSAENAVAWELAAVLPWDPAAPPLLGAQANVGRWPLGPPPPIVPPPPQVDVRAMAVVSGQYSGPRWQPLYAAAQEADVLGRSYAAVGVPARSAAVFDCIAGQPRVDVLHFAVHGISDIAGVADGLVMADEEVVSPEEFRSTPLAAPAFVFLNACQVGAGAELLGSYAGMAESLLAAGAAAVIAPLWPVDDAVARDIAVDFYARAFAGASPADVLRVARGRLGDPSSPASATWFAYRYYGDPSLHLHRLGSLVS